MQYKPLAADLSHVSQFCLFTEELLQQPLFIAV